MSEFNQLCVWPGVLLTPDEKIPTTDAYIQDFERIMEAHFGCRFRYEGQFKTLAGQGGEGGRNDVLFYVHDEDIGKFTIPRLAAGIRWWGDYINNCADITPPDVAGKYPQWPDVGG